MFQGEYLDYLKSLTYRNIYFRVIFDRIWNDKKPYLVIIDYCYSSFNFRIRNNVQFKVPFNK